MENDIMFESEIISRVAEKLGMTEAKVKYHFEFLKNEIVELAWKPDIHSIQFPHLGTMYRNMPSMAHIISSSEYLKPERRTDKIEKLVKKCREDVEDIKKKYENSTIFYHHSKKMRLKNAYFALRKTKKELEKFQNND